MGTVRRVGGREDRRDDVGLVSGHVGASKAGEAHRRVDEPAARSTAREMRVDHVPFRLALLAVQPGGEVFLTLRAVHVTLVAHRIPRVPVNPSLLLSV